MPPTATLATLLEAAANAAAEQQQAQARVAARVAWVEATAAALRDAQRRVEDHWNRILDDCPEDLEDEARDAFPEPPEQAELDALHASLTDVRNHDRWPRELYWGAFRKHGLGVNFTFEEGNPNHCEVFGAPREGGS